MYPRLIRLNKKLPCFIKFIRRIMHCRRRILRSSMLNETPACGWSILEWYLYVRPRCDYNRDAVGNLRCQNVSIGTERERESEREISIQQLLCTDCAHLYSWLSMQVEEIMSIVIVLSVLLPIGASRERTDEEGSRWYRTHGRTGTLENENGKIQLTSWAN